MTEQQALLAAVIANPADDLPRTLYADWLDENGESERAEFVRVQLQLARPKMDCHHARPSEAESTPWCEVCQLREREREALKSCWSRYFRELFPNPLGIEVDDLKMLWMKGIVFPAVESHPSRGFIRRLRCLWANWRKAAESLYWHPSQTVECPACGGDGYQEDGMNGRPCRKCRVDGRSTGTIARPCPLTAQPLEIVELTTWPINIDSLASVNWFTVYIGTKLSEFTRLKCETCDGSGLWSAPSEDRPETHMTVAPCPDCHGKPLNRWTCPTWPSVVFVMPEPIQIREIQADLNSLVNEYFDRCIERLILGTEVYSSERT